ncbi:hypothetical protein ETAA8_68920 [Anatilimnocola aggregata]|uniref:Uncharacterized protein n=1 Tax=Anatilimnocola aggregata TaxID=2528021 RepID=A0A517YNE2_9BACT|nr:hypothetical protein [Anatilimnocola aggregata]QDU31732.1 hypothetical protein ETAA8_68920 [Anatilimnocola aggregata]
MRRIAMVVAVLFFFVAGAPLVVPHSQALAQVVPAFNAQPLAQPVYAQPILAQPQRNAEAEQVRGWYRDYLGREPGPELTAWVELLRGGMSPVDVQATILGSDEFFNSKGRDQQTFVLETLQAVTWNQPTATDLRQWTDRLTQLRGDRFALVREILMTNTASQPNGAAGTIVDLSTRLVAAAKLLGDTAAFELTGTLQGQQVSLRSQALYDATESFRRAVAQRNFRPETLDQELRVVERSFDAVQTSLSNPPGTAPSTASIARRVSTLLSDTRASLRLPTDPIYGGGYPQPLPGNPGGTGAIETQRLLAQIDSISRGTQSIIQMYQSRGNQDYTYNTTLRDLDTFAGQLDNFRLSVQRSSSGQRLQWELQQLQQQAARITPQLMQGQPPVFTRLYWQSVESGLLQLSDTLARSTGIPSGTVPGGNFPGGTPTNPGPIYRPNQDLLLAIDQAMAQSDAFLAGLTPFVFGIPEVPRLQRDVRTLKGHLAEVRQSVVQGDAQLASGEQMRLIKIDFDTAYTRWSTIVEGYKLINYTKLSPVGRSIDQIDLMLQQDKTYVDVARPVYGSRVEQLLRALNQDSAAAQTALQGLVSYTEQRAIQQSLAQLDSYSQTLANLQRDRIRTYDDQRRTVALMQRVAQNIDANTVRLEDRALALRDRDGQLRGAELRRSLERINGALNDLEREVNQ